MTKGYKFMTAGEYMELPSAEEEGLDRFDLEAQIQKCWQVTDDIDELYNFVGNSSFFAGMDSSHEDMILNYLLGMKTIYEAKFDTLWRMFEKMVEDERIL